MYKYYEMLLVFKNKQNVHWEIIQGRTSFYWIENSGLRYSCLILFSAEKLFRSQAKLLHFDETL